MSDCRRTGFEPSGGVLLSHAQPCRHANIITQSCAQGMILRWLHGKHACSVQGRWSLSARQIGGLAHIAPSYEVCVASSFMHTHHTHFLLCPCYYAHTQCEPSPKGRQADPGTVPVSGGVEHGIEDLLGVECMTTPEVSRRLWV